HLPEHIGRRAHLLDGLGQNDVIERAVGVAGKIGVGIALDDREAARDTLVDARLADLDAAAINAAFARQKLEQRAIPATHLDNACIIRDERRNQRKVWARGGGLGPYRWFGVHAMPRARAAESMKPLMVASSSGSSSKKASWPLSLAISTKLTLAAT